MALSNARSRRDVDPTLCPDSRLAFRRPGRQTHGAHRTQGIIFADVLRSNKNSITKGVVYLHYFGIWLERLIPREIIKNIIRFQDIDIKRLEIDNRGKQSENNSHAL